MSEPGNDRQPGWRWTELRRRLPSIGTAWLFLTAGGFALDELAVNEIVSLGRVKFLIGAMAVGLLLGALERVRIAALVATLAVGAMLVVQWVPGPAELARLEYRADSLPASPVDAIMVLSAGLSEDGRLNQNGVDRLLEGIRLYRQGVSSRLVVSRIEVEADDTTVTSDADQRFILATAGVDPELHVLAPVGTTRLEAVRMAELARPNGWHRIVLVTSPTHTRRACATFEAVGLAVTCRPSPDRRIGWHSLAAPLYRTEAFGEWLSESLGEIEYRARGWIRR